MENKEGKNFEQKLKRLSEIVDKAENSILSLEETMKLYEEGNALIKELKETLNDAELKIKVIKDN